MFETKCGGERPCPRGRDVQETKFIVVTGGPGAGKTAVLELLRQLVCERTAILPETAGIIYGGGFWRLSSRAARVEAQSAIFHTQVAMERLVRKEKRWHTALCDRGTLDGLAYWPESEHLYWKMQRTSLAEQLQRYDAVIHLRCPTEPSAYNRQNPLRTESIETAGEIDRRIERIWTAHPNYIQIGETETFIEKADAALRAIRGFLPDACGGADPERKAP